MVSTTANRLIVRSRLRDLPSRGEDEWMAGQIHNPTRYILIPTQSYIVLHTADGVDYPKWKEKKAARNDKKGKNRARAITVVGLSQAVIIDEYEECAFFSDNASQQLFRRLLLWTPIQGLLSNLIAGDMTIIKLQVQTHNKGFLVFGCPCCTYRVQSTE